MFAHFPFVRDFMFSSELRGVFAAVLLFSSMSACDDDAEDTEGDEALTAASSSDSGLETTGDLPAFFTAAERSTILTWLGPLPDAPPPDPTNRYADTPEAAAFGQKLFFDPRYSGDASVSCATCHAPETGFDDARANTSLGLAFTDRSAMPILNGAYGAAAESSAPVWQFWDGRCDSQWSQALQPPESPVEMGSSRTTIALHLYDHYRAEYEAIFGAMPALRDDDGEATIPEWALPGDPAWQDLSEETQFDINSIFANFGKAIAAYERRLVSRNSRFDAFWQDLNAGAADSEQLTQLEKEGLRVFITNGRCLGCHGGPNFTDGQFHNIAVAQQGDNIRASDDGRAEGIKRLLDDLFNCAGPFSDHPDKSECPLVALEPQGGELGAFKTPTLRGISSTAPYMHTGDFATLEDVIHHYDIGGAPTGTFAGTRDELVRPLGLTGHERQALVAFLATLDGEPMDPALMAPPQ